MNFDVDLRMYRLKCSSKNKNEDVSLNNSLNTEIILSSNHAD